MSKEETERRVPNLRFKGFTDDWMQEKLNNFVSFYSGLTYSPADVTSSKDGVLVLRSSNIENDKMVFTDNIFVKKSKVNSKYVEKNDLIVVVRNGSRPLLGKHALVEDHLENTVIGAFMTGIQSQSPHFVNNLLSTVAFKREIHKNLGATINQITNKNFRDMKFFIPNLEEANKIGELLKKLNHIITLEQKKHDLFKKIKEYCLNYFFYKNSKQNNWQQQLLGDFIISHPSRKYITKDIFDGIYPVIQQGDEPIIGYSNNKPFLDYRNVVLFGDHTLSLYKPKEPFLLSTDGIKILGVNNLDSTFFYYLLENFIPQSQGYKRHFSILKDTLVTVPIELDQQKLIAKHLKRIDSMISIQNTRINLYLNLKKYFLNNLFV